MRYGRTVGSIRHDDGEFQRHIAKGSVLVLKSYDYDSSTVEGVYVVSQDFNADDYKAVAQVNNVRDKPFLHAQGLDTVIWYKWDIEKLKSSGKVSPAEFALINIDP